MTDDPEIEKEKHNYPSIWMNWHVKTGLIAKELLIFFREKYPLKGEKPNKEDCPYIYVYKIRSYTKEQDMPPTEPGESK